MVFNLRIPIMKISNLNSFKKSIYFSFLNSWMEMIFRNEIFLEIQLQLFVKSYLNAESYLISFWRIKKQSKT
jgi:hypothetical protein